MNTKIARTILIIIGVIFITEHLFFNIVPDKLEGAILIGALVYYFIVAFVTTRKNS